MTLMPGPSDNVSAASNETLSASQLLSDPPGATLKRARDARKLDLDTAADQLNLSASVVKALEEDAYDKLPSPTFIRGYIRCYARLLSLSGDDLVRSYERIEAQRQPQELEEASPATSTEPRGGWLRWVILSVVVMLGVVSTLWLGGTGASNDGLSSDAMVAGTEVNAELATPQLPSISPPIQESAQGAAQESGQKSSQIVASIDLVEDPGVALSGPVAIEETPEVAIATPQEVTSAETLPTVNNVVAQAPDVAQPAIATSDSVEAVATVEDTPVVVGEVDDRQAGLPTASASTPEKSSVIMTFNDECWVEVWDASGQRIYANLRRAGHLVSLEGVAPIEVKLGNGSAVKLEFNGNPVLFASSKRTGVAHVTLSPEVH